MVSSKPNGQPPSALRQRRPSTHETSPSSPPPTLTDTAKTLQEKVEHSLLLIWDDLPPWRRDNAFILSGYRQSRASYAHALRSLFYLHNESVNIWSHLLGALTAVASAVYAWSAVQPRYESATRADVLAFACFFGGAVLCLGMSATFHLLIAHSEAVMKWGNKLDYTGIVALIVGSYVPAIYYGFFCKPNLVVVYLSLIHILGLGCAIVSWVEKFRTSAWRPYRAMMFIALGLSGVVPVIHGTTIYGFQGLNERMGLTWVLLQGALYIFGAVLYAARFPERTSPGAFDIWGSSHQIFHIFVLLAAATHFKGMAKAFDYHHTVMGSHCIGD